MKIDLNDLTQAHIEECRPHIGECQYFAPCIIGTLISEDQRGKIMGSIDTLVLHRKVVEMPAEQVDEALALQQAFDNSKQDNLRELLAKRNLVW